MKISAIGALAFGTQSGCSFAHKRHCCIPSQLSLCGNLQNAKQGLLKVSYIGHFIETSYIECMSVYDIDNQLLQNLLRGRSQRCQLGSRHWYASHSNETCYIILDPINTAFATNAAACMHGKRI